MPQFPPLKLVVRLKEVTCEHAQHRRHSQWYVCTAMAAAGVTSSSPVGADLTPFIYLFLGRLIKSTSHLRIRYNPFSQLSIHLPTHLSFHDPSIHPSIHLYNHSTIHLYAIHSPMHSDTYLLNHLSIHLAIHPFIYLFIHTSGYLSSQPFIHPSSYMFTQQVIHPSIHKYTYIHSLHKYIHHSCMYVFIIHTCVHTRTQNLTMYTFIHL